MRLDAKGRLMGKIIDVDKAQEALDRAARRARSGSAEVRAGRFVLRDARRGRVVLGDAKKSKPGATRVKASARAPSRREGE
jgi:hypothetical protein